MRVIKWITFAVVLVAISVFALAQEAAPAQTPPTIKHTSITNVPSNSGKEMFKSYCAVCHGADAKGDGPAASALKTAPPDLTLLAQKNGGKYPSAHISSVIRGQTSPAAHGNQDMPVWGPLFSSVSQGNEAQVHQRIANLVAYIQTLQAQ